MKKVILALAILSMVTGIATACPILGLYNSGNFWVNPEGAFIPFHLDLYLVHSEYYFTAVEYQLKTPWDLTHQKFVILNVEYPDNHSVELGSAFDGHSLAFWPPCTGYPEGCDLLARFTCMTTVPCDQMWDFPVIVGPHPITGYVRGTYWPDNEMTSIHGASAIICAKAVPVESTSWGAMKSMFRD
ncbi:MAG TPA: hypothetical protein VLA34_14650 [Candidatus Krumholzibacterium sp.]|nr:hypothetical protein [Candidatus Krumholzibacterium sp.]